MQASLRPTSFIALTGGRAAGIDAEGTFFRKGIAGDWVSTLTPELNLLVLQQPG